MWKGFIDVLFLCNLTLTWYLYICWYVYANKRNVDRERGGGDEDENYICEKYKFLKLLWLVKTFNILSLKQLCFEQYKNIESGNYCHNIWSKYFRE